VNFSDSEASRKLLERLDGLPLALAQAAAFMKETGTSIEEYLEFYENQLRELIQNSDQSSNPLQDYPSGSVWTTWLVSFKRVQAKNQTAAKLLLLWAHFNHNGIWFELFSPVLDQFKTTDMLPGWFEEISSSKLRFKTTLQTLLDFSLAEVIPASGGYSIHPVVHTWVGQLQEDSERFQLQWLATCVVGWAVPRNDQSAYWTLQQRILPHARSCLARMKEPMPVKRRTG
jgi:hypothetical protein